MNLDEANWSLIPEHCRDGLREYIKRGRPTGSFLMAVLRNDLRATFECADDTNRAVVFDYIKFLYNDAPTWCWGSPAKVERWMAHKGLDGLDSFDTSSSTSRQHYIDTGRFLKVGEVVED